MEPDYSSIFPERRPGIEYDASLQSLVRKRDAAQITINETALLVWQLCDGTQSITGIIDLICSGYSLKSDEVVSNVLPLLQQLHDQQCLDFYRRQPGFTAPDSPPLVNYYSIPADLLENLEQYRHLCEPWFPADDKNQDDSSLSEEALQKVIHGPLSRASSNPVWRDMKLVNTPDMNTLIRSISKSIREFVPVNSKLVNSGHALYGAGGSMGWHTNEDLPGQRIYCNWAEKADANYFRYRDPDTGKIVTLPEPAGWSMKSFYIPPRPAQIWHCLYAGSQRIALGFAEFEFGKIDRIVA